MIYITGDVHCPIDVSKLNTKNFPEQKQMTKNDFLIICGDMGIVWNYPFASKYNEDIYWQKWFKNKPFTTLFIDGNHENHDMLNQLPIENKFGGKVHKVTDSVYHLMRGEIYTLQDKTFFCFGGARSHDREYRIENISWWPNEMASKEEMQYGVDNLAKVNNKVDYIITHCASSKTQNKIEPWFETDEMTRYFNFIQNNVEFKHWYFGHYHVDKDIDDKFSCLYYRKIKI